MLQLVTVNSCPSSKCVATDRLIDHCSGLRPLITILIHIHHLYMEQEAIMAAFSAPGTTRRSGHGDRLIALAHR